LIILILLYNTLFIFLRLLKFLFIKCRFHKINKINKKFIFIKCLKIFI
jgi:hypothetical protein